MFTNVEVNNTPAIVPTFPVYPANVQLILVYVDSCPLCLLNEKYWPHDGVRVHNVIVNSTPTTISTFPVYPANVQLHVVSCPLCLLNKKYWLHNGVKAHNLVVWTVLHQLYQHFRSTLQMFNSTMTHCNSLVVYETHDNSLVVYKSNNQSN